MKFITNILLILLFSINGVINNDSIIENEIPKIEIITQFNNQDIVYRGIINPILISTESAIKYEASGDGLKKTDKLGHYKLSPQTGKEMVITVIGKDKNGNPFEVKKTFKIKDISSGISQINGKGCKKCEIKLSKKELSYGKVSHGFPDLLIEGLKVNVVSFKMKLPGKPTKIIKGNRIQSSLIIKDIQKVKRGARVHIFDIQIKHTFPFKNSIRICKIDPILIKIID